jgi:Protein of unknown function (DUF1553)/Protein of unknown function (DUF1549)
VSTCLRGVVALAVLCSISAQTPRNTKGVQLWVLQPVVRPPVPTGVTKSANPIDAFIAAEYSKKGLHPTGPADKLTLLRRVYLDLIGIPPSPAEQAAFVNDAAPDAYEKVVDRLLASEQHGVRYARHWLDVLRYADADERMTAAAGIHYWRDWVIYALNSDLPYDQFVRTQLTGYRTTERTQMAAVGVRSKLEPRPDDLFALGFLARGDVVRDGKNTQEMPIMAVETISTAFMGMTVGCAKCHDHMYDPITQRDFYSMKALFDPLAIRKVTLASAADIMAQSKALDESEKRRAAAQAPLDELVAPYRQKLYEDRVAMLPADVQTVIRKAEKDRTVQEQKIADDYFPVLRIDSDKIQEVMPPDVLKRYKELQAAANQAGGGGGRRGGGALPAFWTVEWDRARALEKSYILTSGEPDRPEKDKPVEPGWPFAPAKIDFREGRIETFSDWLTSPQNPMFSRVAVNRLWQWHFGQGLQKTSSDFGALGGSPSHPQLLDWLAAEMVARKFSMKEMHRLMVTSDTYRMASEAPPSAMADNIKADPEDTFLWRYRVQRLDAEAVWDSILNAAGSLDLTVGGPSFTTAAGSGRRGAGGGRGGTAPDGAVNRRGAYMIRGFSTNSEVTPNFLQVFDVDDGRAPCPMRTQTVTAPQGLFLMNSPEIESASAKLAERLLKESNGDLKAAVELGYRLTAGRLPSSSEKDRALSYIEDDPSRLKGFAWLLYNLDEFIYVR